MNKHILMVMKWLDDPNSVSQEERAKNRRKAACAYWTACATYTATYDEAYVYATNTARYAAKAAYTDSAYDAVYWVDEYFEITGEDRNEYIKELEK